MSLLLHAITDLKADTTLAQVVGLRGEPLVTIEARELLAWATWLPGDAGSFTRKDVLDHHRVVSELFTRVDACLPARFPTLVADEHELSSQVTDRASALAEQLAVVRGACELAVTAVWTAEPADNDLEEATPGRRYLLRRASSQRRRDRAAELADTLETQAGADLIQAVRQVCPSAAVALSLALLLRRASTDDVRGRLGRDLGGDVRILISGPWAPYTFADARPIASRET